jgi:hypothetical protein
MVFLCSIDSVYNYIYIKGNSNYNSIFISKNTISFYNEILISQHLYDMQSINIYFRATHMF